MPTLSWLTRDDDLKTAARAPYRLLEEVPDLGYGDRDAGNMLIQGDNLEALKALFVPKREHILSPLNEILAAMRSANAWPWDAVQTDLKRNHVLPHLLGHLPADEAAAWKTALEAEATRLDAATGR